MTADEGDVFRQWITRGRERVEVDRATWRLMMTALLGAAVSSLFDMPAVGVGFCFLGLVSAAICAQRDRLVRRWQHCSSAIATDAGPDAGPDAGLDAGSSGRSEGASGG